MVIEGSRNREGVLVVICLNILLGEVPLVSCERKLVGFQVGIVTLFNQDIRGNIGKYSWVGLLGVALERENDRMYIVTHFATTDTLQASSAIGARWTLVITLFSAICFQIFVLMYLASQALAQGGSSAFITGNRTRPTLYTYLQHTVRNYHSIGLRFALTVIVAQSHPTMAVKTLIFTYTIARLTGQMAFLFNQREFPDAPPRSIRHRICRSGQVSLEGNRDGGEIMGNHLFDIYFFCSQVA